MTTKTRTCQECFYNEASESETYCPNCGEHLDGFRWWDWEEREEEYDPFEDESF